MIKKTLNFIGTDYRDHPLRFVLEVFGTIFILAGVSHSAIMGKDVVVEYLLLANIFGAGAFGITCYMRRSVGLVVTNVVAVAIATVGLLRMWL